MIAYCITYKAVDFMPAAVYVTLDLSAQYY